ncbi:CAAD domain-containing protein [Chlorogloeopsis sp. ULAP01]|uniref:CAAD domain-containing protein n=1 Tax=Chlorogloeopsis sp. ULAP01 TaxID=3056483 RepID=UPI0025AB34BB|nr:CAAD domain-containing protein [Chlorogloeopsis sp. ULAP01]MDM9381643.1 CAAD domain-containing protein [Chlorogloeopsis sp. ULAP01]
METDLEQQQYVNPASQNRVEAIEASEAGKIAKLPSATKSDEQFQEIGRKISEFLAQLPEKVARFVQEYKLPVVSFVLLVVTAITLRIVLALLNALNDIPLVTPFMEMVGIGYTIWFTFRYLLKASTRQELAAEIRLIKKQILGRQESETLS